MNIKNPEAQKLARELAMLTGESLTAAVTEALRERLDKLRHEGDSGLANRLVALGNDCASRLREPFCSTDHGDLLYDEYGLAK